MDICEKLNIGLQSLTKKINSDRSLQWELDPMSYAWDIEKDCIDLTDVAVPKCVMEIIDVDPLDMTMKGVVYTPLVSVSDIFTAWDLVDPSEYYRRVNEDLTRCIPQEIVSLDTLRHALFFHLDAYGHLALYDAEQAHPAGPVAEQALRVILQDIFDAFISERSQSDIDYFILRTDWEPHQWKEMFAEIASMHAEWVEENPALQPDFQM